ncbi:ring and YY1 binding protein isoform X2 [Lycorma delicatula]|uniref:ring and YY1 binding protein isoform X2 n=1 Tax=Lycorma delicatula TaxID=130591 RepID=UPI003F515ACC
MDQKKSPNRTKRQAKVLEDNYWDCSVCTYRNTAEAFKCLMCDVRKGTSTRKPRINPQLVAQQVAQQYNPTPAKAHKKEGHKEKSEKKRLALNNKSGKKSWHPPRLKNVDRSSAQTREVTVNNVTVVITEYKAKAKKPLSDQSSSTSSENGSQSESSTDARSGDIGTDSRSS